MQITISYIKSEMRCSWKYVASTHLEHLTPPLLDDGLVRAWLAPVWVAQFSLLIADSISIWNAAWYIWRNNDIQ